MFAITGMELADLKEVFQGPEDTHLLTPLKRNHREFMG